MRSERRQFMYVRYKLSSSYMSTCQFPHILTSFTKLQSAKIFLSKVNTTKWQISRSRLAHSTTRQLVIMYLVHWHHMTFAKSYFAGGGGGAIALTNPKNDYDISFCTLRCTLPILTLATNCFVVSVTATSKQSNIGWFSPKSCPRKQQLLDFAPYPSLVCKLQSVLPD